MAKKTIKAYIDVINKITEMSVKDTIPYECEVDDEIKESLEDQVAKSFTKFVCDKVRIMEDPKFEWASAYIHKSAYKFIRADLIILIY